MEENLPLVFLEDVTIGTNVEPLLVDVSFVLHRGDCVQLLGETGQGKSLLLEVLAGRHRLTKGRRKYPAFEPEFPDARFGIAPRFKFRLVSSDEQRRVSLTQMDFYQARWQSLWSSPMTVEQYLAPANVLGLRPFEILENLPVRRDFVGERAKTISDLELDGLMDRTVAQLSNGELRKLLLATAHLAAPDVLLLDDPFGGLSASSREHLVNVFTRWKTEGQTLVFSARADDELAQLATRHVFVERGRIRELEGADRVFTTTNRQDWRTSSPQTTQSKLTPKTAQGRAVAPAEPIVAEAGSAASAPEFALIECTDVTVRMSGKMLLDGITWKVMQGENHLVTGPNGSGKTTLLAVILGDHPQSYASDVTLLGLPHGQGSTLRDRRRRVGYVAPELVWHYPRGVTLHELVASGFDGTLGLHRELDAGESRRISDLLGDFELAERAEQPLECMSEGTVRLGLLMRALVHEPRLLLLDEPTQELGVANRTRFLEHLNRLAATGHTTFVLVTHHVEECPRSVTHHLALDGGTIQYSGRLENSPSFRAASRGED
ncbi:MAG: ATP-binding cassette domain-containing protein [Polyangiaceae bacterium]